MDYIAFIFETKSTGKDDVVLFLLSLFLCVYFRCERLEEQLNDLTELHQNEILNLKQELASMEEKIAYQSYERARDIQVTYILFLCI